MRGVLEGSRGRGAAGEDGVPLPVWLLEPCALTQLWTRLTASSEKSAGPSQKWSKSVKTPPPRPGQGGPLAIMTIPVHCPNGPVLALGIHSLACCTSFNARALASPTKRARILGGLPERPLEYTCSETGAEGSLGFL